MFKTILDEITAQTPLRPRRKSADAQTTVVYSFKVSLQRCRSVWRKIEVCDHQSLRHLHDAIQEAFGWDDDHLYEFFLSNKKWKGPSYTHPDADGPSAARAKLHTLRLKPGQKFLYLFDFGDEWWHQVEVVGASPVDPKAHYPRLVDSRGEPPAQYEDDTSEYDDWC